MPHGIPYEGSSEDYRTTVGNLFTEDVEAAKALMEEAGYPGGEGYPTLTLITQNDQEKKDVAQAMQAMWKENLGVNVEIVTFEPKVYWDEQTAGNFDICYDGWTEMCIRDRYTGPRPLSDTYCSECRSSASLHAVQ